MANEYNDSHINEYETYFIGRNDIINRWGNIISSWSMLPGLVGFWPMSSVQRSTGNAYDLSGQGRTLTYTGNPTYNIYNNFVPYIDFDGTGDYLARADETDLDILGTETINAAAIRGLTVGGWFWTDTHKTVGDADGYITKATYDGNQVSYMLVNSVATNPAFYYSPDGTTASFKSVKGTMATGAWYFLVARFIPSTSISLFSNNVETINATAIDASIFNSTAPFEIGSYNVANNVMDGRASLCFVSHQAFSNALINAMFQQSRILFNI